MTVCVWSEKKPLQLWENIHWWVRLLFNCYSAVKLQQNFWGSFRKCCQRVRDLQFEKQDWQKYVRRFCGQRNWKGILLKTHEKRLSWNMIKNFFLSPFTVLVSQMCLIIWVCFIPKLLPHSLKTDLAKFNAAFETAVFLLIWEGKISEAPKSWQKISIFFVDDSIVMVLSECLMVFCINLKQYPSQYFCFFFLFVLTDILVFIVVSIVPLHLNKLY